MWLIHEWIHMHNWWNDRERGKQMYWRKTCSNSSFITNIAPTDLGVNLGLCNERLKTNHHCMSYTTTICISISSSIGHHMSQSCPQFSNCPSPPTGSSVYSLFWLQFVSLLNVHGEFLVGFCLVYLFALWDTSDDNSLTLPRRRKRKHERDAKSYTSIQQTWSSGQLPNLHSQAWHHVTTLVQHTQCSLAHKLLPTEH